MQYEKITAEAGEESEGWESCSTDNEGEIECKDGECDHSKCGKGGAPHGAPQLEGLEEQK